MINSPLSGTVTINRALVGVIAIVMLVGAGALWFFVGSQNVWTGACLKIGLVMAAFWMALPSISRHGDWGQISWGGLVSYIGLAMVLLGKRIDLRIVFPILFGVAITMMVLRPKSKSRSK